mmetsp:Transcript_35283/g.79528  ORF Transcript_35283/g.79528 Transcript_35283/m.79528 type:complete len:112 (+) Transcript_35283:879-1214(+)
MSRDKRKGYDIQNILDDVNITPSFLRITSLSFELCTGRLDIPGLNTDALFVLSSQSTTWLEHVYYLQDAPQIFSAGPVLLLGLLHLKRELQRCESIALDCLAHVGQETEAR